MRFGSRDAHDTHKRWSKWKIGVCIIWSLRVVRDLVLKMKITLQVKAWSFSLIRYQTTTTSAAAIVCEEYAGPSDCNWCWTHDCVPSPGMVAFAAHEEGAKRSHLAFATARNAHELLPTSSGPSEAQRQSQISHSGPAHPRLIAILQATGAYIYSAVNTANMPSRGHDAYSLLGVPYNATTEEIDAAFEYQTIEHEHDPILMYSV